MNKQKLKRAIDRALTEYINLNRKVMPEYFPKAAGSQDIDEYTRSVWVLESRGVISTDNRKWDDGYGE